MTRIRNRNGPAWPSGAIRIGFADVLTALVLLAVLLYASYRQFGAYQHKTIPRATAPAAAPNS